MCPHLKTMSFIIIAAYNDEANNTILHWKRRIPTGSSNKAPTPAYLEYVL